MSAEPTSDDAVFDAAEAAFARGEFRHAGELWATLGDSDALFNAANAFRDAGDREEAKVLYARAASGGTIEAHLNLAYILEDEGHIKAALRELAAGVASNDPGASVEWARRNVKTDPERALELARRHRTNPLVAEAAEQVIARGEAELGTAQNGIID